MFYHEPSKLDPEKRALIQGLPKQLRFILFTAISFFHEFKKQPYVERSDLRKYYETVCLETGREAFRSLRFDSCLSQLVELDLLKLKFVGRERNSHGRCLGRLIHINVLLPIEETYNVLLEEIGINNTKQRE